MWALWLIDLLNDWFNRLTYYNHIDTEPLRAKSYTSERLLSRNYRSRFIPAMNGALVFFKGIWRITPFLKIYRYCITETKTSIFTLTFDQMTWKSRDHYFINAAFVQINVIIRQRGQKILSGHRLVDWPTYRRTDKFKTICPLFQRGTKTWKM